MKILNKRSRAKFVILLLLTLLFIIDSSFNSKTDLLAKETQTYGIDKSSFIITVPDDYSTIQQAIDAASPGDVIYVKSGVYYEKIDVYKSDLVIMGEDRKSTIIDGDGNGPVVRISANNVTFTNFTLRKSGSRSCVEIYAFANFSFNNVLQSSVGVHVSKESVIVNNFISGCGVGVSLYYCSMVIVKCNSFSKNTVGISMSGAHDNFIANNTITESVPGGHGITVLQGSFNNSICWNLIWNNSHGIWLSGSSHSNRIIANTIAKNDILGIELTGASDNIIYHNNFIENKKQVTTNTTNIWDNGYPSGGNYWSDYKNKYPDVEDEYKGITQSEPGSDGIWDKSYQIVGKNIDHYPLVRPFGRIPDFEPPKTSHDYDNKWHNQDFTIHLTANDDLSGVENTFYRINDGKIQKVSVEGQPFINTEGANNTLEF